MPEIDIERLQTEISDKLNSEEEFAIVTVVTLRKLVILSDINASLVYLTEKAGKKGVGCIVGMPSVDVPSPNVSGPERELRISVRVMEQPTINQDIAGGGTGKTAEAVALAVQESLHQFEIEGLCALYCAKDSIRPNNQFEGVIAYDVNITADLPRTPKQFCVLPAISGAPAAVTIAAGTPGATTYYTQAVSPTEPPLPWSGAVGVSIYAAPFAVAPNTIVRWAAYKAGLLGSDIGRAIIT